MPGLPRFGALTRGSAVTQIEVLPLAASHREQWDTLARAYKPSYLADLPDSAYARTDGRLVGIAHFLFHTGIWSPCACYLEDLFVEPAARGRGVARMLIEAVAEHARGEGAGRLYWLTHETNATARALYDRIAARSGFIEYEYPLINPSAGPAG